MRQPRVSNEVQWRALFRQIPLLGPLVDCRLHDHGEAIKQVLITVVISTLPFSLGALVLASTSKETGLQQAFWLTIWNGELFMSATALLAPVLWIALEDRKGSRAFPGRTSQLFSFVMIVAVASVFYGLGLSTTHLKQPFTFHISVGTFWAAVTTLYLSTVYNESRTPDPIVTIRKQEDEFTSDYGRHRHK